MTPARLGVLILAAGASRRFGPDDKLLHEVEGLPLAAHSARLAAALNAAATLAIIPENAPARAALFSDNGIDTQINPHADQGQGSSLAHGIRHLSDTPGRGSAHSVGRYAPCAPVSPDVPCWPT
ncbi:NTP transferase domain-containing protein [Roseovarius confluentis]|uniref:NTP transferase domain-containing protein n=1 Tax=Roseovarius confluentis TaxID=1852027 RepID=UPI003BAB83C9